MFNYEPMMNIEVYSHFFKVRHPTYKCRQVIWEFVKKWITYHMAVVGRGKRQLVPNKIFAGKLADNSEYRFHIGQYQEFIKFMNDNYISDNLYTVTVMPIPEAAPIDVELLPNWTLIDYQEAIRVFIVDDSLMNRSRLVPLQTGKGKTVTSLSAIPAFGTRTAIVILPAYIDKWCSDIVNILNVDPKEIMVIQGGKTLKGLIDLAGDGELSAKFIVISISTLKKFYKSYETNPYSLEEDGYSCAPDQFFEHIGVGTVIIDEVHQHLHAIYKMLTYTHVSRVIALSATFIARDTVLKKVQSAMFPPETRFDSVEFDRYIKVTAVGYSFVSCDPRQLNLTERGSNYYSHNAFEKSILRLNTVSLKYMNLVNELILGGFLSTYQPGDKLMIFASSINMCTFMVNWLKIKYPQFDVRRYVEDDPYEDVIEPDIRVSTILSSGTAIDIPQLTCSIMTVSIDSPISNLQALGRLRKIPDRDVKFYYIYCDQIDKHVAYHRNKVALFRPKTESIKEFKFPVGV